jgi:hypothetical protein
MNSIRIALLVFSGFALAMGIRTSAEASLTLTTGLGTTHAGNLVANGSFEIGAPPSGTANLLRWATGTSLTPFAVPAGWTSFGSSATYASWGNDGTFPQSLVGSAPIPDGNAAMYFGNGGPAFVDQPPTFNADGSVSFPAAPNFSSFFGPPATLSQTINTPANPAPLYKMSFWVSGEDAAGTSPFQERGIFGFQMTNVLPGNPVQWLAVPNGVNNTFGTSYLYEYTFAPLNPLLPVDIMFINPGHLDLAAYSMANFTTELVMDDMIINSVPEPTSWALAAWALFAMGLAHRRLGRGRPTY